MLLLLCIQPVRTSIIKNAPRSYKRPAIQITGHGWTYRIRWCREQDHSRCRMCSDLQKLGILTPNAIDFIFLMVLKIFVSRAWLAIRYVGTTLGVEALMTSASSSISKDWTISPHLDETMSRNLQALIYILCVSIAVTAYGSYWNNTWSPVSTWDGGKERICYMQKKLVTPSNIKKAYLARRFVWFRLLHRDGAFSESADMSCSKKCCSMIGRKHLCWKDMKDF